MLNPARRPMTVGLLMLCALSSFAFAQTEIPNPAWTNYGTYYDSAAGLTGAALKTKLNTIITTGFNPISYDSLRSSLLITDRQYGLGVTTNGAPSPLWGAYDRATVKGVWDAGATWNREHIWPQSKLGTVSISDMFDVRPALVSTNGGRANNSYGGYDNSGNLVTGAYRMLPVRTGASTAQFFPGDFDKGDIARALFYMTTRYTSLNLIATNDGETSSANTNVGDLTAALHWNYLDMPDNFERRRNQMIYANTENASLSQKNRNPYVDHPEYVWSVFGGGNNDSQITVNTSATAGTSSKAVDFGRVIVGGTAPTLSTSVAVSKTGADPTTFAVTTAGAATADGVDNTAAVRSNRFNAFDYGAGSKSITMGLAGVTTDTAGVKSGTVTVDNTDISTGGAGEGSADGDDTVNLSLTVLDHSNASFSSTADVDSLNLSLGVVDFGRTATKTFSLANLLSASGYTAGLDLDSIAASGDTDALTTNLATFNALAGGGSDLFTASFSPTGGGAFSATYVLGVSDENIAGATTGNSLTLTLSGISSAQTNVPEPAVLVLTPLLMLTLRRRRAA